jgi:hypothetical protein
MNLAPPPEKISSRSRRAQAVWDGDAAFWITVIATDGNERDPILNVSAAFAERRA